MAMTLQSSGGDVVPEINTTPLIDVMLVLLTLLIITLPMQTHAVKINLPRPGPALPIPVVLLEVDFDGAPIWNGWRIDQATLDRKLTEAASDDPQPEMHLMANRIAKYGAVASILADVQRHGLTKIGFVDAQPY